MGESFGCLGFRGVFLRIDRDEVFELLKEKGFSEIASLVHRVFDSLEKAESGGGGGRGGGGWGCWGDEVDDIVRDRSDRHERKEGENEDGQQGKAARSHFQSQRSPLFGKASTTVLSNYPSPTQLF